jgi:hypothetical protein
MNDLKIERRKLIAAALAAAPVALALWLILWRYLPPVALGMDGLTRLVIGIKCCCVAGLLCFLTGLESVSHQRLNSPAINPLEGYEPERLRIDLRYVQNTLEQFLLFILGLLALTSYCQDAGSMRAVFATTVVWILSRFAFWIGYRRGAQYRGAGLVGMMQSMLVLLYICVRFGYELAGLPGAIAPAIIFACIEAYLVYENRFSS